jgi:hypothetical protein
MGPRHWSRGRHGSRIADDELLVVSMGPRHWRSIKALQPSPTWNARSFPSGPCSARTGSGTSTDRQSENAPKSFAGSDRASPSRRRGLGSVLVGRRLTSYLFFPCDSVLSVDKILRPGRLVDSVGTLVRGKPGRPSVQFGAGCFDFAQYRSPAPSALAGSKLAHNHHVPRIMRLDRPSQRFDRRGATPTQGNKENLISVQVDDIIQA